MKSEEMNVNLQPANAACMLYGHDFDDEGKCKRIVPDLLDKTKSGGKCKGRRQ